MNRKNVLEQAGSSLFIPKANMGNVAWLNLRGNRPVLSAGVNLEEKQEDQELNASYDHIEAASMIIIKVELASKDIIF